MRRRSRVTTGLMTPDTWHKLRNTFKGDAHVPIHGRLVRPRRRKACRSIGLMCFGFGLTQ